MLVAYYYITMFGIYIFARCIRRCLSESFAALQPLTGVGGRFLELHIYLQIYVFMPMRLDPTFKNLWGWTQHSKILSSTQPTCWGHKVSINSVILINVMAFVNQNFRNLMWCIQFWVSWYITRLKIVWQQVEAISLCPSQ